MEIYKVKKFMLDRRRYRFLLMAVLLTACFALTYYFHVFLKDESLFSHFFYVPIILSALWWQERGLIISVILALLLIMSHHFFRDFSITFNDYLRAFMFISVSVIITVVGKIMDYSEVLFKRANRAMKVYSECNKAIIYAKHEPQMLKDVCKAIIQKGGYRFAWIGFKEDNADKTVTPVAQAGHGKGYTDDLGVSWDNISALQGMTGSTINKGTITIIRSILTDPRFAPWRELALERGFRSAIALPLKSYNEIIGALSIYATEPDAFDKEEVSLLQELARDLSYGIDTLRIRDFQQAAEIELERHRTKLEELVYERTKELEKANKELDQYRENLEMIVDSRTDALKREIEEHRETEKKLREYRDHLEELVEKRTAELKQVNLSLKEENTQKEWLYKKLEDKTRELESFVHTASHDLKEPLVLLGGYTSRLIKKFGDSLEDEAKQYLHLLKDNVQRMETLIRDLLELSRAGKVAGEPETINVDELIDEIYSELKHHLDEKNISMNIARPLPVITGDRVRIRQVFSNLISNAIKFIDPAKEAIIEIGASTGSNGLCRYYVRDNGIGISSDHHNLIFKEFHRVKDIDTEGTGIGLAIVKKIVEHYNGKIWVDSEPGTGSTFYLEIPEKSLPLDIPPTI